MIGQVVLRCSRSGSGLKVARRSLSNIAVQDADSHIPRMDAWPGLQTGSGGRMSNAGQTVCVFGATGFLGSLVVHELGRCGTNVVVCTQGDDMSWRHLKVAGDYGKIVPSYISLNDEDSIRRAIEGCDTVVNLMGKHYETKHYVPTIINCSFEKVHIQGAEMVARIARELDVKHLVHVSSAAANKSSLSRWAKTKALGEEKVLEQFPGAVIVRPNVMYGEMDRFIQNYAMMLKPFPFVPLVNGGQAKRSPVYVGDAALAIGAITKNYPTAGMTFNLSGPHEYTQKQIFEFVMEQTSRVKPFVDVPTPVAEFTGKVINNLPNPWLNDDNVRLMLEDFSTPKEGEQSWEVLGIDKVSPFEQKAFNFLVRHIPGGHFVGFKEN